MKCLVYEQVPMSEIRRRYENLGIPMPTYTTRVPWNRCEETALMGRSVCERHSALRLAVGWTTVTVPKPTLYG